jgi:hypothetical protein
MEGLLPEDLPDAGMLAYYAERFPETVRSTTRSTACRRKLLGVGRAGPGRVPVRAEGVAEDHASEEAGRLGGGAAYLVRLRPQERLHARQLPPWLKKDVPLLAAFLALVPADFPVALGSEHFVARRRCTSALAAAALRSSSRHGKGDPPVVRTAPFGYARLRRVEYGEADLGEWARRLAEPGWDDLFAFFKHEDEGTGPRLAARFREIVEA